LEGWGRKCENETNVFQRGFVLRPRRFKKKKIMWEAMKSKKVSTTFFLSFFLLLLFIVKCYTYVKSRGLKREKEEFANFVVLHGLLNGEEDQRGLNRICNEKGRKE
jgi:hypothetical protein